jgi:hypothetical protein
MWLLWFSLLIFSDIVSGQGCIQTYTNLTVSGFDLTNVTGSISSCCQACQQQTGCMAASWLNGTCFLKSSNWPLYNVNGSYTVVLAPDTAHTYSQKMSYDSTNFFDALQFTTNTNGSVHDSYSNFTDKQTAMSTGLAKIVGNQIYLGSDNVTVLSVNNKIGRNTIRLESTSVWNSGLFFMSFDHIPDGPGVWPAWWTYGQNSDISIMDSTPILAFNFIELGTNRTGCANLLDYIQFFTGLWYPGDAEIRTKDGKFGPSVNNASGGIYVMEWTQDFIRV